MSMIRYLIQGNGSRKSAVLLRFSPFMAIFLLMAVLAVAATGCGEEGATSTPGETEPAATSTGPKPLTDDYVRELAVRRIDDAKLVREASITGQGDEKKIVFKISRPETCHDGAVVGIGVTFAQKLMAQLFKYPEVSSIEVQMYGTDSSGAALDELALRVMVDRATAQGMDWFAFTDLKAPQMATEYYAHPRIQSSFDIEGGDPNGPKTATTPAPTA